MKKFNFPLVLVLIFATLLRVYNLTAASLWHDEAFSALLINYSWKEMFYRIGLDVHPPVYYIVLRLWSYIFGHSLWALRGFSMFFGVATVYATYLFVKAAFKRQDLALGAALLMAVNPFQIQYVTEARMYTFGTFVLILSAYFLVQAFDTEKWKYWLGVAVTTSLAMYTHYYLFFSVFAIGLFAFYCAIKKYKTNIKDYKYFVSAYVLALLSFVPWLKTFIFQFSQVENSYWIPKITRWSVTQTNYRLITGSGADPAKPLSRILIIAAAIFTVWVICRLVKRETTRYKWLVLMGLILPFLGSLALSLKQSIYIDRYFLFAALFYTIAFAIFIFEFKNVIVRYTVLAIVVVMSVYSWGANWKDLKIPERQGMGAAATYLNNNVEKNDKVDAASSFIFFTFKYYNHTGVKALLSVTSDIKSVNQLPHFAGTAILTDQDLLNNLAADKKPGDTVWMLWTDAFGGSKLEVPKNWIQIDEKSWQDVHPYPGTSIVVTQYKVK